MLRFAFYNVLSSSAWPGIDTCYGQLLAAK